MNPVHLLDFLLLMGTSLLLGSLIALAYAAVRDTVSYSPTFFRTLVLLCGITALVMNVIGSDIARAFGLVGALSVIRFRAAIKDTLDIVFIFFSLSVGMAIGTGHTDKGVWGTAILGVAILGLHRLPFHKTTRRPFVLKLVSPLGGARVRESSEILDRYCRSATMINMLTLDESGATETNFAVDLRPEFSGRGEDLLEALRKTGLYAQVLLLSREDEILV